MGARVIWSQLACASVGSCLELSHRVGSEGGGPEI